MCKLTGTIGKLVDSHIIPKSLTKPTEAGAPLLQSTKGQGHKRRWSSWYDSEMVTREGEDILRDIDDAAIKELRRKKLIWSGWGHFPPVFETLLPILPNHGMRCISDFDQKIVARFFQSIAWRASVSSLQDMRDCRLEKEAEEMLRTATLGEESAMHQLPVSLIQLSTLGTSHNHSPYLAQKFLENSDKPERTVPFVRIYVDGLIAHVYLEDLFSKVNLDEFVFLNESNKLFVLSITYESSFQYENMLVLGYESQFGPLYQI
ncbi:hypothetical protein [Rhodophyticola porphyridii]|uniref:hypothetical protein n=1 Tax=Rhodophyticola porphyridii TaxID=1852017 RepID=UPI0035CFD2A6